VAGCAGQPTLRAVVDRKVSLPGDGAGWPRRLLTAGFVLAALVALVAIVAGERWLAAVAPAAPERAQGAASSPEVADLAAQVAALRDTVDREARSQQRLEDEVASLRESLFELGYAAEPTGSEEEGEEAGEVEGNAAAAPPEEEGAEAAPREGTGARRSVASNLGLLPGFRPGPSRFDVEALVAVGVPLSEAQRLKERWSRWELDKLDTHFRAMNAGWLKTPRYQRVMERLRRDLLADVGDEGYDRILFAVGRPNRVLVSEVLEGSNAERAGFRAGDAIVTYEGKRVFTTADLQLEATAHTGGSARVEILRDGQLQSLRADRGALGVLTRPARRAPLER
jgi:hypothetical protein